MEIIKDYDEKFEEAWNEFLNFMYKKVKISYDKASSFEKLFRSKTLPQEMRIEEVKKIAKIFFYWKP